MVGFPFAASLAEMNFESNPMRMSRRATLAAGLASTLPQPVTAAEALDIYIGCYTDRARTGIWRCRLETQTGRLTAAEVVAHTDNVSSMAIHPNGRWLYAVNEVGNFRGAGVGSVTAFEIATAGPLKELNQVSSFGSGPCFISFDPAARTAYVANYGGGSVAALRIEADGRLSEPLGGVVHPKPGGTAPHAHAIHVTPDGRTAWASDLGLDRLTAYAVQQSRGALIADGADHVALPRGSGPSNLCIHPSGNWLYALHETDNRVTTIDLRESPRVLGSVNTLPIGIEGKSWSGDVLCHPDGQVLYTSNCGHESISRYRISADGRPIPVDHTPSGGLIPRGFILNRDFLIAVHAGSGHVQVFRIQAGGRLEAIRSTLNVARPICVRIEPSRV